jgi:hypothetical protein
MIPKPKPKPKKKKKYPVRLLKYWKKPKTKLQEFENKVWSLQSEMVRLRDKKCVECGTTEHLTQGHVVSSRFPSTRYDWMNVHAQCRGCNLRHSKPLYSHLYDVWFVKKYGSDAFDDLSQRAKKIHKLSIEELENLKMGFELLIESLKKIPSVDDIGSDVDISNVPDN